jgi:uncharacterized protein YbaP (TraB family)
MRSRSASALLGSLVLLAVAGCHHAAPQDDCTKLAPEPPVTATGSSDPWEKSAHRDPLKKPFFWALEKDGKCSYAFGTFHMGIDPATRVPAAVWKKLEAEPAFAMETDLSDPSLGMEMAERDDGKTLHQELGSAYWQKLEDALTPEIAQRVDAMRPTIAATMLSMRGLPPTTPMDGVLLAHAQAAHKQIAYLEPASVQVHALVKWMDTRALEEILDDLKYNDQTQKDMLAAYIAGDEAKVLALSDAERTEWKKFGRSDAEYDQMMDEMLYHRNASWIDHIVQLHEAGGVFVAVGAMHLIGPRSVLALLHERGFKVTRLTP